MGRTSGSLTTAPPFPHLHRRLPTAWFSCTRTTWQSFTLCAMEKMGLPSRMDVRLFLLRAIPPMLRSSLARPLLSDPELLLSVVVMRSRAKPLVLHKQKRTRLVARNDVVGETPKGNKFDKTPPKRVPLVC